MKTLLGFITTQRTVWVSTYDAAELLKCGMRMTSAEWLLRGGPFGIIAGTNVYVDKSLPRGAVRTVEGRVHTFH